jgi:molybdopterin/thiamine biosynthesis adenylyltransferase
MSGVKHITLIDPDVVEESNRCRVLFKKEQVGMRKTEAVAELIYERRDCQVDCINFKTDSIPGIMRGLISPDDVVIDCRDNTALLPDFIPKPLIKCGYDGLECTLHVNPDYDNIMGSGGDTYRTVPSYCVPAAAMGTLAVQLATIPTLREHFKEEKVTSFNLNTMFVGLFEAK